MEEIINSVMQSPENTNPNVLRSQLQNIGGSDGENPNTQQTITGTMANPWGDVSYSELAAALSSGNAHAVMRVQMGETIGQVSLLSHEGARIYGGNANVGASLADSSAGGFSWDLNGSISYIHTISGGEYQDFTAYAAGMHTNLTIYWHPMP